MKIFPHSFFEIVLLALILEACATVPVYKPLNPQRAKACPDILPNQPFRAVHQIEMESAHTGKSIFIGAAKCEPAREALQAVLMSVEGMVLFDAEVKKGGLRVISAFPPLNDPAFARGLMVDVSFVLLKSVGAPLETGSDEHGLSACRWSTENGSIIEQAFMRDGTVRIRHYDDKRRITKEALAFPPFDRGLPSQTRLRAFGPAKYSINLILMDVELID